MSRMRREVSRLAQLKPAKKTISKIALNEHRVSISQAFAFTDAFRMGFQLLDVAASTTALAVFSVVGRIRWELLVSHFY